MQLVLGHKESRRAFQENSAEKSVKAVLESFLGKKIPWRLGMTDFASDEADSVQTLQDIIEHGNDWFVIEGPFDAEMIAATEGRKLDLVRRRGGSLSAEFIEMALSLDDETAARNLVRSEMRAQVLHEIALIEAAESDAARPATERIEARQIRKIISDLDEDALSLLATRLERAGPSDQPDKLVECGSIAPNMAWRLVAHPVERWAMGRKAPHSAAWDAFWTGRAIVTGKAEMWVLERRNGSEAQPFLQVLVDCWHPGIVAFLGRSDDVPEDSVPTLLEPLIRAENLKPWHLRREGGEDLWPVWYDARVSHALRTSYTANDAC